MYIPYLRGKQEEQIAIIESPTSIFTENKVLPLFEPVNISNASIVRYGRMCQLGKPFILIINPKVHGAPSQAQVVSNILGHAALSNHNNFHIGFLADSQTSQQNIDDFLNLFPQLQKVIIHQGEYSNPNYFQQVNNRVYYHIFKEGRVTNNYINTVSEGINKALIHDGFNKLERNADYDGTELFSELYMQYEDEGFDGFGDFLTIGDHYRVSGGPANAVAIHLTHEDNNRIMTSHFISDRTDGVADVAGKFSEALEHLNNFVQRNQVMNTLGLQDFNDLYNTRHFPGLGRVKRISIKHHIELVCRLI